MDVPKIVSLCPAVPVAERRLPKPYDFMVDGTMFLAAVLSGSFANGQNCTLSPRNTTPAANVDMRSLTAREAWWLPLKGSPTARKLPPGLGARLTTGSRFPDLEADAVCFLLLDRFGRERRRDPKSPA